MSGNQQELIGYHCMRMVIEWHILMVLELNASKRKTHRKQKYYDKSMYRISQLYFNKQILKFWLIMDMKKDDEKKFLY